MDRDILTRTITESVVDRCIREIEEDPKRSVRKLVDLGGSWPGGASSGSIWT